MKTFVGRLAVVTGGGTGVGRELVRALASEGCSVAACDIDEAAIRETAALARASARKAARVSAHVCDVTDAGRVNRFRDHVVRDHRTAPVDLLFTNAHTAGAASFLTDDQRAWERMFDGCWRGVYNVCRAFVPLVIASTDGYVVNSSAVTMSSAGAGAVRGFTEALVEDFRSHAPHVKVALMKPEVAAVSDVLADIRAG